MVLVYCSYSVRSFLTTQLINSRLQDIYGKDTTYDFDYIKSLKSGPVEDAGYEGLPKVSVNPCDACTPLTVTACSPITVTEFDRQIKGVLPTDKDLASADALLKRAIDTDTSRARHT
jgi:hypothetical protein